MIKALIELIKVKSIITILMFIGLFYGFIIGKIEPKDFMLIVSMVATYYFNKKDKLGE